MRDKSLRQDCSSGGLGIEPRTDLSGLSTKQGLYIAVGQLPPRGPVLMWASVLVNGAVRRLPRTPGVRRHAADGGLGKRSEMASLPQSRHELEREPLQVCRGVVAV